MSHNADIEQRRKTDMTDFIIFIVAFVLGMMYGSYAGMKYGDKLRDPELMEAQRRAKLQILLQQRAMLDNLTNEEEKEEK